MHRIERPWERPSQVQHPPLITIFYTLDPHTTTSWDLLLWCNVTSVGRKVSLSDTFLVSQLVVVISGKLVWWCHTLTCTCFQTWVHLRLWQSDGVHAPLTLSLLEVISEWLYVCASKVCLSWSLLAVAGPDWFRVVLVNYRDHPAHVAALCTTTLTKIFHYHSAFTLADTCQAPAVICYQGGRRSVLY